MQKKPNPKGLDFFFVGGAEGNLRSLSRLAAALRSAHAFSLTPPWRQKRVPDTFLLALRFPILNAKQKEAKPLRA